MKLAPIVLFTYNRLDHLKKTIETLQKNFLAKESELYIFSDAAKNYYSQDQVKKVRRYLRSISGFKKISIIERTTNWGLADNIIDGVTQIVKQYQKIIVLEDDLMTNPYFLSYMNDALEFYQDKKKVWSINASIPTSLDNVDKYFFIKIAYVWGWGTWEDRWSNYKKDPQFFLDKFNTDLKKEFTLNNNGDFLLQLQLIKMGVINTWDAQWYATCFFNNGLCLTPKQSFVNNIGHDGSGENCAKLDSSAIEIASEYFNDFPEEIKFNEVAFQKLCLFYQNEKPSWTKITMRRLKRLYKIFKKNNYTELYKMFCLSITFFVTEIINKFKKK